MNRQEELWAGQFGDDYQRRSPGNVEANLVLFEHALRGIQIDSVIEYGAGIGNNLRALRALLPKASLAAVEINPVAWELLPDDVTLWKQSALACTVDYQYDLVLTKGFLIHIAPDDLFAVYEKIYRTVGRYLMVAEYYNPTPVSIPYRGQADALWKRDFASELLGRYTALKLIDYGFVYHRDPHPQDDLTWFLMEKRA